MTAPAVLEPPHVGSGRASGHRRLDRVRRVPVNWPGLLFLVALVALWQVLVNTGVARSDYLPSPAQVLRGLGRLASGGGLTHNIVHTVSVVLIALLIAAGIGIAVGLIVGFSELAWSWSGGTIDVLRSLPVIALVPVALVVFGLSATSETVVAVFAATWPILLNTAGAVRQVHPRLYDVGRTLRLPRRAVFVKLALPAAAPAITVGVRIGMTVSLLVTITVEMVGNPDGIGFGLVEAQNAVQPAEMYAYVLVVLLIGLILNAIIVGITRLTVGRS